MKNQERWHFAQKYAAREMVIWGAVLACTAVIGFVYHPNEDIGAMIGIGLLIAMLVVLFKRVEKAIEMKFYGD